MDTLPEQHIDSLPERNREEAYRQVGIVCAFRSQGLSEYDIAKKAKFASVEDMYFRLERWGLHGLLPLKAEELQEEEKTTRTSKSSYTRKPRPGEGKAKKLPPVADAIPLFQRAISTLTADLEYIARRSSKEAMKPCISAGEAVMVLL
jgi:hypothetical protein